MTTRYEYEGQRRGTSAFISILLASVLGAVTLGLVLHNAQQGWAGHFARFILGGERSFSSTPDVVEQIKRLNRLETVVYSLDTVVENKESSPLLPDVLAGDKLLMIVHGQTVAGIDFGKLTAESIQISSGAQGRAIRLTLPRSEIFATTVDNRRSRVYARNTGLFVAADPNLETATRQKAEADLQQAALQDGVLNTATANAQGTVRAMLQGLGFAHVDVQ